MKPPEIKKVDVIYVRVSSIEQVKNNSLDVQEQVCRSFSEKDGHTVLKVFREEGESAKTTNRTMLQEMMRCCEKNKKIIGRVVFYNVSRMSRDVADYHVLKVLLKKYGITIVSATESFDDSPAGKLHETILSAFAQFDNDVRSVRTIEGMKARLAKGLWSGSPAWGYRKSIDKFGKKVIVPHEEKSPIVRMLFEMYATGKYSFKELAVLANKAGVKSRHGLRMRKQLVAKIVRNPIYCGKIVVPKFGISVQGSHEAIVTEQLFNEANPKNKGVANRKLPRNKDNQDYPLRGILCGSCGRSLSGGKTKGRTKYYEYYGCFNSECEKRKAIKKNDLENDFTNFLLELTPNESFFDILGEAIKIAHKLEINSVTSSERKINIKIAELKDRKDKLLNLKLEGGMPTDEYILANADIISKIKDLENSLINLSPPELGVENVIDLSIKFLKNLPENWKELDVKDLRVLRPLLFPQNVSYYYPTIKTAELCCIYNVKSQFDDDKTRLMTLPGIEPGFKP